VFANCMCMWKECQLAIGRAISLKAGRQRGTTALNNDFLCDSVV